VRKFHALHKFHKERRRSPKDCFECGDTTHFIADCPKRKKLDSSNKYDYTKQNDYNKGDDRKKYHFGVRRRRSFRRWCPERVQPLTTSTSPAMTPPTQRRIRSPCAR
jgi:hypothetical protein